MIGMTGLTFTVGYDALTIYFSPYELAAYAYGEMIIELPYEDYPGLVREEYQEIPDNYMMKVRSYDTIRLSDGRRIKWAVEWDKDNFTLDSITFTCDGKEETFTLGGFSLSLYVAHIDGTDYLYLDQTMENDYHMIDYYNVSGDEFEYLGYESGSFYTAPYDPFYMQMSTFCNMMSSYHVWQYRKILPDGSIEELTPYNFIINSRLDFVLTLKEDMTVEYRENFMDTDTEMIDLAAGNELSFYSTDNKTYVDFLLEGRGGYVRIYVNAEDWPQTVDGKDIEDLFDGILFAG